MALVEIQDLHLGSSINIFESNFSIITTTMAYTTKHLIENFQSLTINSLE